MIRLFTYVIMILLLGLCCAILESYNFTIIFDFGHTRYMFSALFAIGALFTSIVVLYLLYSLLKQLFLAPGHLITNRKAVQKRQYIDVLTNLVAAVLSADDIRMANLFKKLNTMSAPSNSSALNALHRLLHSFLKAKNLGQAGQPGAALERYKTMAQSNEPNSRDIGFYMLYKSALERGDVAAAHEYCINSFSYNKALSWANNNILGHCVAKRDWAQAQTIWQQIRAASAKGASAKDVRNSIQLRHTKALLDIAHAKDILPHKIKKAQELAQKAFALAGENINVAIIYSQILFQRNELRKANQILEAAWQKDAHPDLAQAYIYGIDGQAAQARFDRAQKLENLQPGNIYSYLALSQAALEWDRPTAALDYAEKAIAVEPLVKAYRLIRLIKERQGKSYIVTAELYDYAWCADGLALESWQAISPLSKTLDAVAWRKIASTILNEESHD